MAIEDGKSAADRRWGLEDRAILVLVSHGGFSASVVVLVYAFFPSHKSGRDALLVNGFLTREALLLLLGLHAVAFKASAVKTFINTAAKAFPGATNLLD